MGLLYKSKNSAKVLCVCHKKKNFETMVVMGWTRSLSLDSWVPPPKKELSCFLIFPHIQELEGGKGSKEEKNEDEEGQRQEWRGMRKNKERERQDRGRG